MTKLTGPELRAALERGYVLVEWLSGTSVNHKIIDGKLMYREHGLDWVESALTLDCFSNGLVTKERYSIIKPNSDNKLDIMRKYLMAEQSQYEARKNDPVYHQDLLYQTTTNCAIEVVRRVLYELDKISNE